MKFEWDPVKAAINLAKHGATFHEAASVLDDPNGMIGFDPLHSDDEARFITAGISNQGHLLIVWHTTATTLSASSEPGRQQNVNERVIPMADPDPSEMLPEYDFTTMSGVVRGKYSSRSTAKPRIVRLADDLAVAFPNDEAVNAALLDYLNGHTLVPTDGQQI